jgi:hypothetical protein
MEQIKFPSNSEVFTEDLHELQNKVDKEISNREKDVFGQGILPDQYYNLAVSVFSENTVWYVLVDRGTCYVSNTDNPSKIERIEVTSYDNWVDLTLSQYQVAGVGETYYTRSSGNKKIPKTWGAFETYYVNIRPIKVAETATRSDKDGHIYHNKYIVGYNITIDDTPAFLTLAKITTGNTGTPAVDTTFVPLKAQLQQRRVLITTPKEDKSDATDAGSYGYAKSVSLEKHIKAVGAGTVTAKNPHGTGINDIDGLKEALVETEPNLIIYQKEIHSCVITTSDLTKQTDLYQAFYPVTDNSAKCIYLKRFEEETTTFYIAGKRFTKENQNNIQVGNNVFAFQADFTTAASNYYNVYLKLENNSLGVAVFIAPRILPLNAKENLLICTVDWNGTSFVNLMDVRPFGKIAGSDIADGAITKKKIDATIQTDGSAANLVNGGNADALHTHSHPLVYWTSLEYTLDTNEGNERVQESNTGYDIAHYVVTFSGWQIDSSTYDVGWIRHIKAYFYVKDGSWWYKMSGQMDEGPYLHLRGEVYKFV